MSISLYLLKPIHEGYKEKLDASEYNELTSILKSEGSYDSVYDFLYSKIPKLHTHLDDILIERLAKRGTSISVYQHYGHSIQKRASVPILSGLWTSWPPSRGSLL